MRIEIQTHDEIASTPGRGSAAPRKMAFSALDLKVEGRSLVIRGTETDAGGRLVISSSAKTHAKFMNRKGKVSLTPDDLKALFEFALSKNLITLSVALPSPAA